MPRPAYNEDDLFKESTMTFGEHLEELRACLFKSLLGLVIGFVIGLLAGGWVVAFIQTPLTKALKTYYKRQSVKMVEARRVGDVKQIEQFIQDKALLAEEVWISPGEVFNQLKDLYPQQFKGVQLPAAKPDQELDRHDLIHTFLWRSIEDDPRVRTRSFNAQEAFSIYIKAAFMVGALIAGPWIFYQLWSFVAAGLYPHEKRYVHTFLPFSVGLFLAGAALAFFFVFEPVLNFLFSFNEWLGIDPDPRINEWMSFVLMMPLCFGIAFQLPLVMLFMERIGIFDVRGYLMKWRVSVLIIFILALILTPSGDPYSMMLMAMPLVGLYFGGILLCKWLPRSRSPYDEPA